MAATPKYGREVSTIDVNMIVVTTEEVEPRCIAITTQTKVDVEPQVETTEAVKNIVKGRLLAQKAERQTITGNTITLTDNVTIIELVEILQGGTLERDGSGKIIKYTPPLAGEVYNPVKFTLDIYSAVMDAGNNIVEYEKFTYYGCQGTPVSFGSEDNVFRVNTYTINSAPSNGQPLFDREFVPELPTVTSDETLGVLTVTSAAGTTSGDTKITVTPAKASGNSYKYKTGASVTAPAYDAVCSSDYTDWNGTADITATTGQKILIVEVDGSNKAKKAGITTVTSKA